MEKQTRWKQFINTFQSKATISTYKTGIKNFFQFVYGKKFKSIEESAERYFAENQDYEQDVRGFFATVKERPPKTIRTYLAGIKIFLMENDVELNHKFWRTLRRRQRGSRAITMDTVPTKKQLRSILTHMRVQGKAFFLMLASSGMRLGEAIQLQIDDVDLTKTPTQIEVRREYTKSGNKRKTFVSSEATEVLTEWLKVRDSQLKSAIGRSRGLKTSIDDGRIFPYHRLNLYAMWNGALDKTELNGRDRTTNRHKIHPHTLRKFFRTRLGAVIPTDIVEALMGHEGYLTDVYRRYSDEDLAKFYKQGEYELLIFAESGEVGKLKKEVERGKRDLQDLVNKLSKENIEIRARIKVLQNETDLVKDTIEKLFGVPFESLLSEYKDQLFEYFLKKQKKRKA